MKASLLKVLLAIAFFSSIYGCSSSEEDRGNKPSTSSSSSIGGSYNLVSMTSNIEVDLNDDGIVSTDLLTEIDPAFFNSGAPELEIKPTIVNNQLMPMMSFYLPFPKLNFTTPGKPHGAVSYVRSGLGYYYQFDNATQTITINNNASNGVYGNVDNVQVAGKNTLKAVFNKNYYDFATAKWITLKITCIYKKI